MGDADDTAPDLDEGDVTPGPDDDTTIDGLTDPGPIETAGRPPWLADGHVIVHTDALGEAWRAGAMAALDEAVRTVEEFDAGTSMVGWRDCIPGALLHLRGDIEAGRWPA